MSKELSKELRKAKIELLEKIAKKTPHLIVSTALTPIVVPYIYVSGFFNSLFTSPLDGYVVDRAINFIENDKLFNFWVRGFENVGETISEYKRYKKEKN